MNASIAATARTSPLATPARSFEPPLPAAGDISVRERAFAVAPRVLVSDKASSRTTVVEVNARDRQGLLARLAHAIHAAGHQLHSAHIATYGERAVDVLTTCA